MNKKYANQLQTLKALCTCGGRGTPHQRLCSLPVSLKFLFLNNCDLENNDLPVIISGQPIFYLNLGNNPFEVLPNNITLRMLRVLELSTCIYLESLLCLPSTLEELYINWCISLKKITFESARFGLREFAHQGCGELCEIQGLFKLVPIANLDEADLGHMKWIIAYEGCTVDLVGHDITRRRRTKVLYEYEGLEYCKSYTKEEEVIGGDLSKFKLTTGGYYLCRRDFFKSRTPDWLNKLVGDSIHCTELQGWRKSRQTQHSYASFMELETFRGYSKVCISFNN
ncbi:hypothetical protein L1887_38589 [Cichorium endivia]|nr:hypothetical protein L1887_38589 [Cichorium endivia]